MLLWGQAVLLVIGVGFALPATAMPPDLAGPLVDIFLDGFFTSVCSKKPSYSDCVTETQGCLDLLNMDPKNGFMNTRPDMDNICAGDLDLLSCIIKSTNCIAIFIGEDEPPSAPDAQGNSSTLEETGGPSGSSTFNASDPSREDYKAMCQFLQVPYCPQLVDNCFWTIEPDAPTPITPEEIDEVMGCTTLFSTLVESAGNPTNTGGVPGTPGGSGPGDSGSSSSPSPDENFVFSGASMEVMCQFVEIPNCLRRVEECSSIMGPDVPVSAVPTKEMLDCATFFVSLAEAAGNLTDSIGVTGRPEGSGPDAFGSSSTPSSSSSSSERPLPSKASLEVMCQFVDIPGTDCLEKIDKCLLLLGPGASEPSVVPIELLECSGFFAVLSNATRNITDLEEVTVTFANQGEGALDSTTTEFPLVELFSSNESEVTVTPADQGEGAFDSTTTEFPFVELFSSNESG